MWTPPTGVGGIQVTMEKIVASRAEATIDGGRSLMELERALSLLTAEQARLQQSLADVGAAQTEDRQAEAETGDVADPATSLEAQGIDDAVAAGLRDRLAAVERALRRVDDGTYGRSIRSGVPIPDARLEADPSAELTVEEAAADQASQR
jgi:DnaK suppressor protein